MLRSSSCRRDTPAWQLQARFANVRDDRQRLASQPFLIDGERAAWVRKTLLSGEQKSAFEWRAGSSGMAGNASFRFFLIAVSDHAGQRGATHRQQGNTQ
ncbi:hypothetical protein [Stenotrophomonas sp. CFBP 13718]|uniref:hypothetical protein n=1 Tax=Stenotrophomonas sp. CFBP 13718 TaxID=2775304 RepID=UPI00177B8136|nr:hypothetical protein [Stenotrophomonas sp. CFBP 13718]MBD8695373.1 hypothetical protein [Stenotrophomonas sp. CFBP 13718]